MKRAPVLFSGGLGGAPDSPHAQERLGRWLQLTLEGEKILVVEVSVQVDDDDVKRSFSRAKTLRAVGVDATPVVIGGEWMDMETMAHAKQLKVEWLIKGEPFRGLIAF